LYRTGKGPWKPLDEWRSPPNPKATAFTYSDVAENRLAAQWAGYSWMEYLALPGAQRWVDPYTGGESKCLVLVAYRAELMMRSISMG
jgi:hypothetical protein